MRYFETSISLIGSPQNINLSAQLALGVRFLQAQTHDFVGTIQMCHTSCFELDAGPLSRYLAPIKTFLDDNPNEVVSVLLTNQDAISVTRYASVFAKGECHSVLCLSMLRIVLLGFSSHLDRYLCRGAPPWLFLSGSLTDKDCSGADEVCVHAVWQAGA